MSEEPAPRGFRARPRADASDQHRVERLLDEVARLRSRFERASHDGRETFVASGSDSYDIGMLAVIHLADFVARELPAEVASALPELARDGLRATRNIAAHNYAGLDNARLWSTVNEHAPALLDDIEAALRAR
ncbi:HepT-like ribonuclease domain-containing protein [Agromyces sp. NPDC049794]|uniref:HepT-like ribonuclease domain-containing protein n=1 Tax=unclassified Agromyces TaxID=2639701 RepID=UPI0033DD6D2A